MSPNNQTSAPFDPGFAPHLIPFLPALQATQTELSRLKNFGQKKMRFKVLDKTCQRALQSTLGFWVGCILWGSYIKYKFKDAPKPISGNSFLELTKDDIPAFAYNDEFNEIEKYIENYSKDVKYYTGANASLPEYYKIVVEQYRLFVDMNENFLESRTTGDIKIPAKFEFLAQCSEQQIDEIGAQIVQIIAKGDLSEFLKLDFGTKLR